MTEQKIRMTCPQCKASGMAPARLAGRRVRCRKCGTSVQLPTATVDDAIPAVERAVPSSPVAGPKPRREDTVFADQELAGSPCPACRKKIFFGDEVVRCPDCTEASHVHCWKESGRCSSSTCAPETGPQPEEAHGDVGGDSRECPVCAEDIPEDAVICPYCSEHLTGPGGGVPLARHNLPTRFRTAEGTFTRRWDITLGDEEMVASSRNEDLRVLRVDAPRFLELTARHVVIDTGASRKKLPLDDVGCLSMEMWLTGRVTPRVSSVAKDALITAIVGIFCCQIVLGIYALSRAGAAQKAINEHPELISGQGMVTAARVIGAIDLILFAVGMIMRVGQISQLSQM